MNVLLISDDIYPKTGGVAQYDHSICKALALNKHNIIVLTKESNTTGDSEYKIIKYPKLKYLSSLIPFIYTLGIIVFKKTDVVILGYFMSTLGLGGLVAKYMGLCKLITVVCGYDLVYSRKTIIDKTVADRIMNNADMVWVDSNYTGKVVYEEFNNKNKIKVLYPIVQKEYLNNIPNKYSKNNKKILTVCRLVKGKGLEVLLDAFAIVNSKISASILEIVGNGPLLGELKKKAVILNLQERVIFTGKLALEELVRAYDDCDIFVMPSEMEIDGRFEGFGIVFIEANARGKAVIGTRHGGIPEAISEWQSGIIVEPGNANELASAIINLVSDNGLRLKMGEAGRARVENHFTITKMALNCQLYLKALNG